MKKYIISIAVLLSLRGACQESIDVKVYRLIERKGQVLILEGRDLNADTLVIFPYKVRGLGKITTIGKTFVVFAYCVKTKRGRIIYSIKK